VACPGAASRDCRKGVESAGSQLLLNSAVCVTIAETVLTRKFKKTVMARIERDPVFAKVLLDEAANLFLSGELKTARVILRDLLIMTLGFEQLARFRMRARPRG
jgi:hypothetical protein